MFETSAFSEKELEHRTALVLGPTDIDQSVKYSSVEQAVSSSADTFLITPTSDGRLFVQSSNRRRTFVLHGELYCPATATMGVSKDFHHSTVTDFAKFLGWSTSVPLAQATW